MPCCVTAVCLCKITVKSVLGESFVFCLAKLDCRRDSRWAKLVLDFISVIHVVTRGRENKAKTSIKQCITKVKASFKNTLSD